MIDQLRRLPESIWGRILLSLSTGLMLALAYPAFDIYPLAFIAFVPLLWALENRGVKSGVLYGAIAGGLWLFMVCHWIANLAHDTWGLNWFFSYGLSIGHGLAVGFLLAVVMGLYQYLRNATKLDDLFLLPILFSAVISVYPMIFYFSLGDSQSRFNLFIQPVDVTGTYGIDFMVVLVNFLLFRLLKNPRWIKDKQRPEFWAGLMILLWFGYGFVQQNLWFNKIETWQSKKIGLVQPNHKATLGMNQPEPGYSRTFPLELDLSNRLALLGAEVIVWPEGYFHGYSYWPMVRRSFHEEVDRLGVPILFHDITKEMVGTKKVNFNSSLILMPGKPDSQKYHKRSLVPFGEYNPLEELPLIKEIVGDFMTSLTPGPQQEVFPAGGMKLVPQICYETVFPARLASAVGPDAKGKVILVQSQDGWYGMTNQPELHLAGSVIRSVENRLPMIHSINNGPSVLITPRGDYAFRTPPWERVAWVGEMPYSPDSGGSFYTENPHLFIGGMRFILVLLVLVKFRDDFLAKRKAKDE